jgi:biotin carboxyl carrier protein
LGIAAAVIALLCLLPIPFHIKVDGRLIPEKQQAVFAPLRGELAKLHVRSGDTVSAGQLLCEFESGELEQQATRLRGEWLTIQEQLQVAIARRGDESKKSVLADRRVLEVQSRELKRQLDLIESRIAGSTIRSPQRGTVYLVRSEEVGEISEGQPVQLGQPILRVVDPDGGYSIEVEIPDRELGYVLDALDESGENTLACRYRLHAAPEAPRQGELMSVEPCASINVDGNTVVRGTIVPGSNQERFATESGLSASIHCGRGAAGFVLFRKIIEQIRML